jgi:DinB superfamily
MPTATQLLADQLDEAYQRVRDRVEGLTDEEFWWEPVPGCWTVRQHEGGRWAADYQWPDPEPSPFTTIAWRLVHVAECKLMYHEYAFGEATLTWPDLDSPHTAADAIVALEDGQALLVRDLASLHDADLDRTVMTNWGDEWPAWRILWTMINHDLHHGAEIGVLRDLFRARPGGESMTANSSHRRRLPTA